MKKISMLISALLFMIALAGCAQSGTAHGRTQTEQIGCVSTALLGAGGGALIGRQFGGGRGRDVLTVAGALAGGAAASQVGCK